MITEDTARSRGLIFTGHYSWNATEMSTIAQEIRSQGFSAYLAHCSSGGVSIYSTQEYRDAETAYRQWNSSSWEVRGIPDRIRELQRQIGELEQSLRQHQEYLEAHPTCPVQPR